MSGTSESSNTRLVVGMAVATGAAGWIPVPLASGWAVSRLRQLLVRQLVRRHDVELVPGVAAVIAGGASPTTGDLALDVVKAAMMRDMRKMLRTLPLMIRFGDVVRTLVLGSYLGRYCELHHPGGAVGLEEGRRIRAALDAAADKALTGAAGALLWHLAREVGQLALALPKAAWALLREALSKGEEAAEQLIEEDSTGLFGRAARAVESGLSAAGSAALDGFHGAFDEAYGASNA
jgi:hypothetical protein